MSAEARALWGEDGSDLHDYGAAAAVRELAHNWRDAAACEPPATVREYIAADLAGVASLLSTASKDPAALDRLLAMAVATK